MPITKKIRVVKIPLPRNQRPPDRPQAFPRMPRLYLELIENKSKIKQDLINQEHVPTNHEYPFQAVQHSHKPSREEYRERHEYGHEKERPNLRDNQEISENVDTKSVISSVSTVKTPEIKDGDVSVGSIESRSADNQSSYSALSDTSRASVSVKSKESDELSVRLKELLADTDDENSVVEDFDRFKKKLDQGSDEQSRSVSSESSSMGDKYSRQRHVQSPLSDIRSAHRTPYRPQAIHGPVSRAHPDKQPVPNGVPPTLAQLQKQGHYQARPEMRDITHTALNEQEQMDKKREILFKFELLKKSYPRAHTKIPDFTVYSELTLMQKEYDSTVRRLSLDSTVESYKQYLIGGFMLTEFVFGNFLGFDMQGFTQQQIISMSSYERLLIELGEKSYVPTGSKWPVELRLLFMIIMNAAFFIVSKMIMRKTGANLMNMINGMNSSGPTPAPNNGPTPAPTRRRRMRGPNIDLDDIPEASDVNNDGGRSTAEKGG